MTGYDYMEKAAEVDWSVRHEVEFRAMRLILGQYETWLKKHHAKEIEYEHLSLFIDEILKGMQA